MDASQIRASYETAVEHQREGRLAEAEALYRAILAADPDHGDTLHMSGGLALQSGRPELAIVALSRATALAPGNALFHTTLGHAYLQLGQPEAALEALRAARTAQPDFFAAHFLIGLALRLLGRLADASTAFEAALALNPQLVEAHFNLAAILQDQGDRAGAIERYRETIALAPDFSGGHLNLGICLAAEGDFRAALPHLERAAALEPGLVEAQSALGNALLKLEQPERAIAAYRKGIAIDPRVAVLHYNLGNAFRELGRLEAALASYREALALAPDFAQAMVNAGGACDDLGRYAEAEAHYRRAVAADPNLGPAHCGLSIMLRVRGRLEEAVAEAERSIALDPALPNGHAAHGLALSELGRFEEAALAFRRALANDPLFPSALVHLANMHGVEASEGRLADESRDYDGAFADYRQGNAIKAAQQGYDHAGTTRQVEALIRTFDRALFASRSTLGAASERPVFVLGMPRSGTTLVEQVLASHPAVHASGELAASGLMIDGLVSLAAARQARMGYPEAVRLVDRAGAELLAGRYLEAVSRDAGDAERITDKLPSNFLRIGLIALLLPRARIIHCQRDPYDTCLSCYFQDFEVSQPFVYELERLGKYYREYERLMAHWRSVLPNPMLEVPYEALVKDPEPWCRRILEHCALEWDERVLRFFATERSVRTASFWQVRQPIYLSSVGRWRHYRKHLGPLFEALGRQPAAEDAA
jgi:tetratricopeptide (TPR) repeat protein